MANAAVRQIGVCLHGLAIAYREAGGPDVQLQQACDSKCNVSPRQCLKASSRGSARTRKPRRQPIAAGREREREREEASSESIGPVRRLPDGCERAA